MEYKTLSNTDPDRLTLFAVEGDIIDMDFYVNLLQTDAGNEFLIRLNEEPQFGDPFAMQCLRMRVRRKDFLLIKTWQGCVSPSDDIEVTGAGQFTLTDTDGFAESGLFDYDLACDNGAGYFTIATGTWLVKKQI